MPMLRTFNVCLILCCLLWWTAAHSAFAAEPSATGREPQNYSVAIHFTDKDLNFPEEYSKSPNSATGTLLDAVQDKDEMSRVQRLLQAEFTKYPTALLKQNLKDIYVVRKLLLNNTSVGGCAWTGKRLYLADDAYPDALIRTNFHHELAHVLLTNHYAHFSTDRWQRLTPLDFHYGVGGLEAIRKGEQGSLDLDPGTWAQGFASPYGKSAVEEDFATLAAAVLSGDTRFWQAVDQHDLLNKKVKMVVAFYHALNKAFTEPYFRQMTPYPRDIAASTPRYNPGDEIPFPNGGLLIFPGKAATIIIIQPGGACVSNGTALMVFYPPGKPFTPGKKSAEASHVFQGQPITISCPDGSSFHPFSGQDVTIPTGGDLMLYFDGSYGVRNPAPNSPPAPNPASLLAGAGGNVYYGRTTETGWIVTLLEGSRLTMLTNGGWLVRTPASK